MCFPGILSLALLSFLAAAMSSAQIGDALDKKGEVQKSLVPADQIPPAPSLSPEDSLKTITVAPGYRVELAASEPQVQEPVVMAFGPDGRIWVAEMRGYMPDVEGTDEDLPNGRIVILTDRDSDGFFEDSTVFADDITLPRALLPLANGVLIGAPPLLEFHQDTDNDGKADKKEIIATDYGVKVDPRRPHLANPERAPNSLLWGYDNWIYSAAYTRKFRYVKGRWQMAPTTFRGQWGLTQDCYGRLYHGSNSDHIRVDVIPSHYLSRNSNYTSLAGSNVNGANDQSVWPARVNPGINRGYRPEMLRNGRLKEFTAAGGQWIYQGDLMPDLKGDYFIPEPAANFVRRSRLAFTGGTVRSENAHGTNEFLTSTDERFRPVNVTTGPDGALYIVDFYRGIIQHRVSLTSYLRDQILDRGLDKHLHRGRIYRIVPVSQPARGFRMPSDFNQEDWLKFLAHPNHWWREQAQRQLVIQGNESLIPSLRRMSMQGPTMGRVHALWTIEGIKSDAIDSEILIPALNAEDPVLVAHAIRLAEPILRKRTDKNVLSLVVKITREGAPEPMLQALLSLGEVKDPDLDLQLAEVVGNHPEIAFLQEALLSGLQNREFTLLEKLSRLPSWNGGGAQHHRLLTHLARGVMGSRQLDDCKKVIVLAANALRAGNTPVAVALLDGLVPVTGLSRRPLKISAEPTGWRSLEEHDATRRKILQFADYIVWPGKKGANIVPEATPLSKEQQMRFEIGRQLYSNVCAACHQTDGRGLEGLAPPLLDSEWMLGPAGRPIRIVLHGVRGPIAVLGKIHTGDMPPIGGALDDDQIASILTYLRREWGHAASPVEPTDVTEIRKQTSGHGDAWSAEELMKIK